MRFYDTAYLLDSFLGGVSRLRARVTFPAAEKSPKRRRTCGPDPLTHFCFLVTLRPGSLLFPTASLGRWQTLRRHNPLALWPSSLGSPPKARFYFDTTGPPARCGRYCPSLRRARRPVPQPPSRTPNLRSPSSPTREASSSYVTRSSTSPIEYGPSS